MSISTDHKIAHQLAKVLAETYSLYLKTHGYHWNVRGMHFHSLHTLFSDQYNEIWVSLDEIAERIRALGVLAPMGGAAFGNLSQILDGDPTADALSMLRDLKSGHETLIQTIKEAIEIAGEHEDDPTLDLMTVRLSAHQKHLWMISASLD